MQMKRIGVIGGGQLAWMMGDAAKTLGVELLVQTPSAEDPAVAIAQDTVFAPVDDAIATEVLAKKCDIITFENEFVNLDALSLLAHQGVGFRPRLEALTPLLDKYHQLCYLRDLGLPVPQFIAINTLAGDESDETLSQLGFPVVLKTRRHGYDGQGTFIIQDLQHLKEALGQYEQKKQVTQPLFLLEEFIPFEKELAVIAARSTLGKVITYSVVETQQEEQVCRRVIAPAEITPNQASEIEAIAHTLLNSLQVVGVFGVELFLTADGKVLINEIAPRTHNSGHFSLDACETSQFEQHLRAVCGLPLGNPALHCGGAVMVNLLGYEHCQVFSIQHRNLDTQTTKNHPDIPDKTRYYQQKLSSIKQIPQAYIHWYGKTECRPGRKLGHVTVLQDKQNQQQAIAIARKIEDIWYPG
jgi:5-(carboxyamino)imidazole ribonucleotide synthase